MADLIQYNKGKVVDDRAMAILNAVTADYNEGRIKTEVEYYYRVKKALSEFYQSLDKPLFKYRPAVSVPIADDYNAMINEAHQDMSYLVSDCMSLGEQVALSFSSAELSRTMLQNEIEYLAKQVESIGRSIAENEPEGVVVFTESFNTVRQTANLAYEKSCTVNTIDGVLTLQERTGKNTGFKRIYIDSSGSNGFPGNTHMVDTLNSELHFSGEDGIHMDLRSVAREQKDTWFEYELIHITDETRRECNSYGFEYAEGVEWINRDNDPLRLKMCFELEEEIECSWFSVMPYLPEIKGAKPCFIEKCDILTSSGSTYTVAENVAFEENMLFAFPPQTVRQVDVTFVQDYCYPVKVGHFYYNAVDTKSMSIFQDAETFNKNSRADGWLPSVNLLNVLYNPQTQWIEYIPSDGELIAERHAKSQLFRKPQDTIDLKAGVEMLDAYRYMIGIRMARAYSSTFKPYSEYVSYPFTTLDPITSIVLESEEYIPGDDGEILKYYVSVDNGMNWHRICPTHRAYDGVYKYTVNNSSIENLLTTDLTKKRSRNLTTLNDVRSVQVKIEMRQPETEHKEYSTPIVYWYRLRLETGGELIEY